MTSEAQNGGKSEAYVFGDCILDADRRELRVSGERVTTRPKVFDLLLYLIRNRGRAVDKDELQDAIWPRSIVTETALTRAIMKARRAVGDTLLDAPRSFTGSFDRRARAARPHEWRVSRGRAACLNSRENSPFDVTADRPRSRRASILCFWADWFAARVT